MDHHHVREQLTGYALGELSPEARDPVEAHLAGCVECTAEARELSRAVDVIGLSTPPIMPPPSVKTRILSDVESLRRPTSLASASPFSRRGTRRFSLGRLTLAAAMLLVVGGTLVWSQQRVARVLDERQAAEATAARLTQEAATVAAQADLAVAILTASDMRRIDLQGLDESRNATARAYWSGTQGLLIVADRLPSPPPGRLYQVWLIGAGAPSPVSAGLMNGQSGRGMLIVPPPRPTLGGPVTVAITDEPAGGLSAPSGSKHLLGSM
jgi:anti-sigma-K factor RskA